jgi:SAM-dependent methyltransferase
MFFPERITNIKPTDKVLEIGPGADPHPRSNVLLELEHASEEERSAHFGHEEKLVTDKKIVYYTGTKFPFNNNEFDYVICSHVLEHVEDLPSFLSEIFRISGKGYFEYPLIYYEYLYNFNVHVNFVKYNGTTLYFKKKSGSNLSEFTPVQQFFYESLKAGHVKIINDLLPLLMEGFEWDKPFKAIQTYDIHDLVLKDYTMIPSPVIKGSSPSAKQLIKQLLRKCF